MDPQAFLRLSIGSLGLRCSEKSSCSCDIKLRGFPIQTTKIPLLYPEEPPGNNTISSFYLETSDVKALRTSGCFFAPQSSLEISVFTLKKSYNCNVTKHKHILGTFNLEVSPEWCEGVPLILFSGWTPLTKKNPRVELHVRVRLDPDPRYVFQFDDSITFSPQVSHLHRSIKQPIFSCKFTRDRHTGRVEDGVNMEEERRERKGWKVKIHDLSGSAVAAAFMATPFVAATGCNWVAKSNPGVWMIVRGDASGGERWQPWGKVEAWRDGWSVWCKFNVVDGDGGEAPMAEVALCAERGGDFVIDLDDQTVGGFVMRCRVHGGRGGTPLLHLGMRHVTSLDHVAVFVALAAAVDLSVLACRPFRTLPRKPSRLSFSSPLRLPTTCVSLPP